jgi:hypothetical protein
MNPLSAQKESEEAKRDRHYSPAERWRHIQEAIAWAEANMPAHLRRNRPRQPKWQPEAVQSNPLASKSSSSQPK